MKEWLSAALSDPSLSESFRGYVMGRGAKPEVLDGLGVTEWVRPNAPPLRILTLGLNLVLMGSA